MPDVGQNILVKISNQFGASQIQRQITFAYL